MLKAAPKATGGDAQRTRFQKGTESPETLEELGIDKKASALAQKLADELSNPEQVGVNEIA